MDTATRLLRLLALLHARPVWEGASLAQRLGVTTRTIRRDIARLRDLDYPVEAVPGPHGGYRMARGGEVPPLMFDDQETLAVALGLQMATQAADGLENAAASALAKLDRVLPERLGEQLRHIHEATVAEPPYVAARTDAEALLVLAQACRRQQRLRFFYIARDGTQSLRHTDPSRLVQAARRWYLVAFDLDRDAWRTFRVDRLRSPITTGAPCAAREQPDALGLVQTSRTVTAYPIKALVRLHLPFEHASALVPRYAGVLETESERTTLWRLGGNDPRAMASWIAATTCHLEVLEPAEVREALVTHLHVLQGIDR